MTATRQFSYNEEDEDLMPLQAFSLPRRAGSGEGQADTPAGRGSADDPALGERAGVPAGVHRRRRRRDVPEPDGPR